MYRVGNPLGGKYLFDGAIHGASDLSTIVHYYFLKSLLESNDPRALNILQKKCLLVIPILCWNMGRYNENYVNLNRNFTSGWSGATAKPWCRTGATSQSNSHYVYDPMVGNPPTYPPTWTNGAGQVKNYIPFEVLPSSSWVCPVCGAAKSTFSNAQDWHGPSAASEPETQAVKAVFAKEKPEVYINFHNWGGPYWFGRYVNSTQKTRNGLIASQYAQLAQSMGVTTYTYSEYGLGAGQASSDAALAGANSFLVELVDMNNDVFPNHKQKPTLEMIQTYYYPKALPLHIALSEAVSDSPPPPSPPPSWLILAAILGLGLVYVASKK